MKNRAIIFDNTDIKTPNIIDTAKYVNKEIGNEERHP